MGKLSNPKIKRVRRSKIELPGGDLLHGMKKSDAQFRGFGELYFSKVNSNSVKAWKLQKKITMNLFVPIGEVGFVFWEPADGFRIERIGQHDFSSLYVEPGTWYGFKGLSRRTSLIVNLTNVEHVETEIMRKTHDEIEFDWKSLF
jgi:dTDP-4-dehydrorhamnose 3,5-epimerase